MPSTMIEIMPLNPTWMDIATRLLLVIAAGALIGLNREAGGSCRRVSDDDPGWVGGMPDDDPGQLAAFH